MNSAPRAQYTLPTVPVPDLNDLQVQIVCPPPPTADELVERLHQHLRLHATKRERERGEPVRLGDEIVCDIVTVVEGEVLGRNVLANQRFELRYFEHLPGFVEQLVGMETFSARTFSLKLPHNYLFPTLSGLEATFYVEIREAFEVESVALDDPKALKKSGLGCRLEEAMEALAHQIDLEQGDELLVEATVAVLDALASRVAQPIPEAAVDEELRRIWQRNGACVLEGKGFSEETKERAEHSFLSDPELREQAGHRIKVGLALAALVEEHALSPDADFLDSLLLATAEKLEKEPSQLKEALKNERPELQQAAGTALYIRAVEFVMARAQVEVLEAWEAQDISSTHS